MKTNTASKSKNKTVLITGGAKGIGAATARVFAKHGYDVIVNYLTSKKAAKALADEIGCRTICADVTDSKQVEDVFGVIGDIDILVNNAGICGFYMLDAMTDEEWKHMMDVNLNAAFYCCRSALPQMIHRKSGAIINVSSMWGITGASCEVAYSAAKAGLIGFTKALAKEVGPSGIQVNCVAPGVIDTDMNAHLDKETIDELCDEIPMGRTGKAEEVANVIYMLAQENNYITGQVISPNGGLVI